MNKNCNAKVPALCRFHGVPRQGFTEKGLDKEINFFTQRLDESDAPDRKKIYRHIAALSAAKKRVNGKVLTSEEASKSGVLLSKRLRTYASDVIKQTFGENSIEYKAYSTDIVKQCLENRVHSETIEYAVTDNTDFVPGMTNHGGKFASEAVGKADDLIRKHHADGVMVTASSTKMFSNEMVVYKNKVGQIDLADRKRILSKPEVVKVLDKVHKKFGDSLQITRDELSHGLSKPVK